jgi:hypothetical protein
VTLTADPLTLHLQQVPPGRRRAALVTAPRRPFAGFLSALILTTLLGFGTASAAAQTVSVSPGSAQVNIGTTQQFTAAVTGGGNGIVIWSLSGAGCAGITCGSITGSGVYTAPKVAPNPPTVTVSAEALSNTAATGSATVQILQPTPIAVTVTPGPVTVSPGSQQVFSAVVTGTSNTAIAWNVTGAGCFLTSCGSIDGTGVYTAPANIPNPPTVTVTATSLADNTKKGSAQVTLAASVGVSVVPPSVQLLIGNQQQFTAQVVGTSNSIVNWSVSGAGCSGAACGTVTSGGLYTAPSTPPSPATVLVAASSAADTSKTGGASVTVVSTVTVSVKPSSAHVNPNSSLQFTATVSGTSNQSVTWSLSGAGCSGSACGQITTGGSYTAPATIPFPNSVTVTATSVANPSSSGTGTVFVGTGSPVKVTTSPATANVPVNQSKQFTATVTGSSNTAVNWSVSGIGCAGPSCGTVSTSGLYTAPATAPAPANVNVTATAQADPTRSGSSQVTIGSNVQISMSPTTAQLAPGQHTQFTATVTGTTNKNVSWSMSSANCAGSACGSLTQAGLYTAPSSISGTLQITVKATSQADGTKTATAAVTVATPVIITVKPNSAQVVINGQQQFAATATGAGTALNYNWSLSGSACPSSCGSITNTGLYTAPSTVPGSAVTVTAANQANASNFGTATVQVIASNDIKLNGHFAFLFQGTDAHGLYQAAGSFVADGKGNISSGLEDINRTAGPATSVAFSGKYTVAADNRGTLTITSAQGTFSYAFALNQSGVLARFIETDASGIRGAGIMKAQNTKAFNAGSVSGPYTVSLTGADAREERIAALADLFPSGSGFIAGASMDVNDGGDTLPTFSRFSGAYTVASDGRGTASLTIPGFDSGTFHFAIYIINAGEFFLLSTDQLSFENPLLNGDALLQAGPFTTSSLSGASVFYDSGWSGSASQVSVGRFTYDGQGNVTMQFDQNAGGTVSLGNLMSGTYAVAPSGRTVLTLTNLQTRQPYPAIVYLISQNVGFIMDASPGVGFGYLEGQAVSPPFSNSDLEGSFTFATADPVGSTAPFVAGSMTFNGNGGVLGNQDSDLTSGKKVNQLASGTDSISPSSNNGRGVILLSLPQKETISVWLATYQRAYALPVDTTDTMPEVIIFEQ